MRVADLVEAEGRSFSKSMREEGRVLRSAASRLGFAGAALVLSSIFFALGFLACLISIYLGLVPQVGSPTAAALTGVLAIALGLGLLVVAHKAAQ
ncbi:MAG: hypothetical protein KF805_13860 [Phycisphaeraceae bacterium]|nr:hypothetical protein [Phycisphaeraceae bacterium]